MLPPYENNPEVEYVEELLKTPNIFAVFAIVVVLCIAGGITYKKWSDKKKNESPKAAEIEDTGKKEEDAE